MIGSIVNHPLFGRGQVAELRNAAREASVRFDNGIRAVVPLSMLSILDSTSTKPIAPPRPPITPRVEAVKTPEKQEQFAARRAIEALRYGIVPQQRIRELTAGLERERASLHRAFDEVERSGGDVRVILGEYGSGKSHFFELAAQEALARNFLVASASLDLREVPPNRPQRIYNALIRNLRYPDSSDTGTLAPLLDRILDQPTLYAAMLDRLQGTIFGSAIHNYSLMRRSPGEALDLLLNWISGEKIFIKAVRDVAAAKVKDFPIRALSQMTTSADQYCYLLNGWSWLASQVGYAGLTVFLDESEHYSLLTQRGQERADNFFKAMIYTALASRSDCRITESALEHQRNEHPFRFTERSELLLMFAVTPSANTFDYQRWLDDDQIVKLDSHLSAAALDELMSRLHALHHQAYGYERADGYQNVARGLFECLDGNLINLRQTIRLATEIFDLCYAHSEYSAAEAVEELRRALLGRV
jgi:hypothetical protein